jgi:hypothetical protein
MTPVVRTGFPCLELRRIVGWKGMFGALDSMYLQK